MFIKYSEQPIESIIDNGGDEIITLEKKSPQKNEKEDEDNKENQSTNTILSK